MGGIYLLDMLIERGINWNDCLTTQKRGFCGIREEGGGPRVDNEIPIFTANREYITKYIPAE